MKTIVSKWILLLGFAAVVIGFSSRCLGQGVSVMPDSTSPCLTLSNTSIVFNYEEYSEFDTVGVCILNTTNSVFTIYDGLLSPLSGDTTIFEAMMEQPSTPYTLNPGDEYCIPFHIQFNCPPTKDVYRATFGLRSSDGSICAIDTFTLHVFGKHQMALLGYDAKAFKDLIPGVQSCQKFYLNNTTPDTIEITKLILTDDPRPGVQWSLKDTSRLPIRLGPGTVWSNELCALLPLGDTMPLTGGMGIVQQNQCGQIDTLGSPISGSAGQSTPASVSDASSQSTDFNINPNPSHGEVQISLPPGNNSTVEIYDVLGNLLLRKQATGDFVWNPEAQNGVTNGTYIVRVMEWGVDGYSFVSSKRLLFVR